MDNKFSKLVFIILCCLFLCGCSNIKVIREKQKKEDEVIKFVTDSLNDKYEGLDIKLDKIDKAYTVDDELIKNAKSYYFKITDKEGNKAYATYKDAFKIDEEIYDSILIESYGAIYNNKELDYYKYMTEKYISKDEIVSSYYASDYEKIDYYTKAKVVYKLNYKLEDMTIKQYTNLLKLGFDLRKYRLINYKIINYDDPEVYFLFKGSNQYYYVSYYGFIEENGIQYDKELELVNDYFDIYNLKKYITVDISDDEYKKMLDNFNSFGKYLLDDVQDIEFKIDNNNAYLLISNQTRNGYYLSILIKFRQDSSDNYLYDGFCLLDNERKGNFDGFTIKSW